MNLSIFTCLGMFILIGLRYGLFHSFFEYIIILFLLVFSTEKVSHYCCNLDDRWGIVGIGIIVCMFFAFFTNRFYFLAIILDYCVVVIMFAIFYQSGLKEKIIEYLKVVKIK